MTKEALKQRLGMTQPNRGSVGFQEALAQPEQEPVAWIYSQGTAKVASMNYVSGVRATPLYTSPPAQRTWVGLTDEEILDNCESVPNYDIGNHDLIQFARAIEAKLKEKNELR
jgi:hypothetical protein